jgi:hypothetical protein
MPARAGLRQLKAWRYVGIYGPELMICLATVRIGPARQSFWAVWDRTAERLYKRTVLGGGAVALSTGRARAASAEVEIELKLDEGPGVECVCPSGDSYAWTRKQGGVRARGTVRIGPVVHRVEALAVIDDTAAYYERHTRWRWCAGIGQATDGRALAWNLVQGVNDPAHGSERTVWIDGDARELPEAHFAADLSSVDELRFSAEATRAQRQNLILVRSRYRQPFGTFSGRVGGAELAAGYGVMEDHDVWW